MEKIKSSEPNVLIISNQPGRWNGNEYNEERAYMTSIESWALAFGADYLFIKNSKNKDLSKYDIIIANSNLEYLDYLIPIAENPKRKSKLVIIIEGQAADYLLPNEKIRRLFDASDLINCINKLTFAFFKNLTKTKVEYIGFPYPIELIEKNIIPFALRKKMIFICPKLLSRWNDYFVAKNLDISYYGYEERVHRTIKRIIPNFISYGSQNPNYNINKAKKIYNDENLIINKFLSLRDYFKANNSAYFWVNLDDRFTWARYVLDAAALRIPIITTKSTGHGLDLFPETCIDNELQVNKAVEIGKRLISDFEFYKQVADYPEGKLEIFKAGAMKKRMLEAIG